MSRILLVSEDVSANRGGIAKAVLQLADGLIEEHHSVSLFTFKGQSRAATRPGLRVQFCPTDSNQIFCSRQEFSRAWSTLLPVDVVHIHGLWRLLYSRAAYAARKTSVPVVISTHGMLEPWARRYHAMRKRVGSWLYHDDFLRRASCLHATSEQECRNIRKLGFHTPIALIPLGVEIPKAAVERAGDRPRRILFLSRFHPKKGLDMLVSAWGRVAHEFPGWQLILRGYDENGYMQTVESMASRSPARSSIVVGHEAEGETKEALFRDADIFVLPSYSENFGFVVVEALARQVPVITTTGTPWQVVSEQGCGWWVSATPDGIAGALRLAMSTPPAQLADMGAKGRALVEREFSIGATVDKLVRVYQWVAGGAEQPSYVISEGL